MTLNRREMDTYFEARQHVHDLITSSSFYAVRPYSSLSAEGQTMYARLVGSRPLWLVVGIDPIGYINGLGGPADQINDGIRSGEFEPFQADVCRMFKTYSERRRDSVTPKVVFVPKDRSKYPFDGVVRYSFRKRLTDDTETVADMREIDQSLGLFVDDDALRQRRKAR